MNLTGRRTSYLAVKRWQSDGLRILPNFPFQKYKRAVESGSNVDYFVQNSNSLRRECNIYSKIAGAHHSNVIAMKNTLFRLPPNSAYSAASLCKSDFGDFGLPGAII